MKIGLRFSAGPEFGHLAQATGFRLGPASRVSTNKSQGAHHAFRIPTGFHHAAQGCRSNRLPWENPNQTPTLKGLNPGRQTAQSLAKILLQLVFSRRNAGRFSRIPCYATKPIATSEEFWRMRGINPVRVVRSLGWVSQGSRADARQPWAG